VKPGAWQRGMDGRIDLAVEDHTNKCGTTFKTASVTPLGSLGRALLRLVVRCEHYA
jgi:hypothetical protein